jgi:protein-L-isoaspartate(D-aspartate) O-methyltransferase
VLAVQESKSIRRQMVRHQLMARGIRDRRVLAAMARVPREAFTTGRSLEEAYADSPLAIGSGQTISQPYIVALMTELLRARRKDRVLEIGTGSGYQTAVLATLAEEVYTMERLAPMLASAVSRLRRLGFTNVQGRVGDGAFGWAEAAPFNGILVTAASPQVPAPLTAQLDRGGRLVIPIGSETNQELVVVERTNGGFRERRAGGVRFVPLVSPLGFATPW